jgi:hypothetical protein
MYSKWHLTGAMLWCREDDKNLFASWSSLSRYFAKEFRNECVCWSGHKGLELGNVDNGHDSVDVNLKKTKIEIVKKLK